MTYDEYLSKRQKMENQAQTLIAEGTKESLVKSDEILDQISKLDEQYTAETRLRMANERALNNEPQMILMPWMTGERLDMTTGRCYSTGTAVQDNTFLSPAWSMTDISMPRWNRRTQRSWSAFFKCSTTTFRKTIGGAVFPCPM